MADTTETLLAACVVKRGVGIGILDPASRSAVLALASLCLPADGVCTEAEANAQLKRCLAEEAACLDTDHVELRRWLVDSGFWQRDGFGRAYRRVAEDAAPPALAAVRQLLGGTQPACWVAAQAALRQRERDARKQAWEQRQSA